MKKLFLLITFFIVQTASAQIEILGLLGRKPDSKYLPGFGAMLKFGIPAGEVDEVNLEIGAKIIPEVEYPDAYGIIYTPLKLGYRYMFNRESKGIYIEPQLGYNLFGVRSYQNLDGVDVDEKFNGVVGGAAFGYLFEKRRRFQADLSLRFESVIFSGGTVHTIGIRYSRALVFGRLD